MGELLPRDRVDAIVLMDQAWPLKTEPKTDNTEDALGIAAATTLPGPKNRTRLNWDHIYGLPWRITLTTRRCDLKLPSTHAQILDRVLEPAPGPVFVLGVHLCGILSIRAVETFNHGPKCVGMVLKPCCLPSLEYVKKKTRWTLGAHSFSAEEVCMWGRYNKNQWKGPVKATLASRFGAWADNLFRGIAAEQKRYDRVSLVEGHYQDAYLFASRDFATSPPSLSSAAATDERMMVTEILSASTPLDILGVSGNLSMRALHRRWAALTKALAALDHSEVPEAAAAFTRVKEAYDTLRAQRPSCDIYARAQRPEPLQR